MDNCSRYPLYNTQGQITSKNMHQVFSDAFSRYLASDGNSREQNQTHPFVNSCFPSCCSPLGTTNVALRVTDIKYHNDDACIAERSPNFRNYRVG